VFVGRIDDGHAIRTCWARAYGGQVNVGAMDEAVNGTDFSAERDLAPAARIADLRLTVLPIIEATLRGRYGRRLKDHRRYLIATRRAGDNAKAPSKRVQEEHARHTRILKFRTAASTMCMERGEAERPVLAQRQAVEQQAVMQRHGHGLTMKRTNKQAA
jgi:hypothetical protein